MKIKLIIILRWTLRVLCCIILLFSLTMFIGETLDATNPLSTDAIISLSIAGLGLVGLGLALKWELTGGIIALVFFIGVAIIDPNTLRIPGLLIFPVIAILFILLGVISRKPIVKNE